jgi:hypothetical protein
VTASRGLKTALAFGLALMLGACRRPPPPPAPAPAPTPTPVVSAPPPPPPEPPKCLSLAEKCMAAADTQLDAGTKGAWFKPPLGWTYAKEEAFSYAASADGFAAIAIAPAAGTKRDEIAPVLEALFTRLEVTKVKLKPLKRRLDAPDSVSPVEGSEVRLWEVDKRRQDGQNPQMKGKPGALLVVVATFTEQPLVGAAFVTKPEGEAQAAAVMEAVQSLRPKR